MFAKSANRNYTATNSSSRSGRFRTYSRSVRDAYNYGFRDGYAAYDGVAEKRGAYMAAKYGYMRGLKAHKKVNKYQAKSRRY